MLGQQEFRFVGANVPWLLEAADDICYRVVDLEDGFKLGRIPFETAEELLQPLADDLWQKYD